ncbi:Hypothetical predicted protein, partial [Paramuricea clavata]
MCGIFCTICTSTDEAQCRRKDITENIKPFLLRRGPDDFGEKQINCSLSNNEEKTFGEGRHTSSSNDSNFIHLAAVVLHLRGDCIAQQPVEDSFGNILVWNGEIFDGIEVPAYESDTTALLRNLHASSDKDGVEHVLKTMGHIHGPWAFVYYQANRHTLWFGRDYFGRRSLLWHLPSSPSDLFALSSVGTRVAEDSGEQFWKEVPAVGIYSVDIRKVDTYFSNGDGNTIDFQAVLRKYPWQKFSSSEYPVCPVRNQFNRDTLDYIGSSTPPGNCSKIPCHSSHQSETAVSKEDIVNGKQNRTPDNSAVSSRNNSYSLPKDTASNSQVEVPTSAVNDDVISEVVGNTCGRQTAAKCHVNAIKYEDNQVDGHSDHTKEQQDIRSCSTKEHELSSTTFPENLSGTSHSSKLSPNNDDAGNISTQSSLFNRDDKTNLCLDKHVIQDHISPDVVEQFANILMEAVRRRVLNLPRKAKSKSCIATVHGNDSANERDTRLCVGNESRSNVGILFSGGLDSIVLAALADRCVPLAETIDLINVAFEQKSASKHTKQGRKHKQRKNPNDGEACVTNFEVPDRITGRNGVAELKQINPERTWNFVEVNVTLEELQKERSNYISHLVSPQSTVLDDSIGSALWFAARGRGNLTCKQCIENIKEHPISCNNHPSYTCPAKVLLVGMGADEQLGGYARHRSRFNKEGWKGLVDEIEMEVERISERNLGRDDR